ncbi:MAG TPA: ABC transporter ATP-binding protein [Kofleriaceae bacterium]|nr:ABC transporter ATP-binding protein [Kofleriaceae bacterium]
MLVATAIDKRYGDRQALAGVSLEVRAGEAVLLVGRNGAGKTTLLRIVTGFLDADAGTVTIDGIAIDRERARAQARLGYLPEHAPAPSELRVADHLRLRARLKGLPATAVERAAKAAAVDSELARPIGHLSKGYRQRVGLADALLGEPPLLVLDEPTSGMDPIQTAQMRDYLASAARAERALLISSHAVADLEPLATRVAVLRDGVLVANDTPAALLAAHGKRTLEAVVVELLGEEAAA